MHRVSSLNVHACAIQLVLLRAEVHVTIVLSCCRNDKKLGRDRVFLQAKWDTPAGSEVFVGYGNSYWRIRDLPPQVLQATNPMQAQAASASDSRKTSAHNPDSTNATSVRSNSMCDSSQESDSYCADSQFLVEDHDTAARSNKASTSLAMRSSSTPGTAPDIAASTDTAQKLSPLGGKQHQHSPAGWDSALAVFERMSICEPEDSAMQQHAGTQQQLHASAAALAAAQAAAALAQNPPVSLWQDGMQTPPISPNPHGASTGRPLSCRHDAPLSSTGGIAMRRQQHSAPKPVRPCSAARNLSACPTMQGYPSVLAATASAGLPTGAIASVSNRGFAAAEKALKLLQASQAGDSCLSPPKARKHMRHGQQDLGQQQMPEGSARRPQRRRRTPDPQLQYNGTMQAAKPVDKWW
jgi:hypothetical protein